MNGLVTFRKAFGIINQTVAMEECVLSLLPPINEKLRIGFPAGVGLIWSIGVGFVWEKPV